MTTFPLGPPLGFPLCAKCKYLRTGPAQVCYACARQTVPPVAPNHCPICSQTLDPGTNCSNRLCRMPDRRIDAVHAIAVHDGRLRQVNLSYKYKGARGWAPIFGRLLLRYVEENVPWLEFDLIVANPTFVGSGSQSVLQHTELVIDAASAEDMLGLWPWDVATPRAVVKTGPTPKSAGTGWSVKQETAMLLPTVLAIPDVRRITGQRVLVYDDVCTTGLQLNALAGYLIDQGGAASVSAVVLGRAPWR